MRLFIEFMSNLFSHFFSILKHVFPFFSENVRFCFDYFFKTLNILIHMIMKNISKFFFSVYYLLFSFFVLFLNIFPKINNFSTHFVFNVISDVKMSNVFFYFIIQIIAILSMNDQIPHQRHKNHCPNQMSPNIHNFIVLLKHRNHSIFK